MADLRLEGTSGIAFDNLNDFNGFNYDQDLIKIMFTFLPAVYRIFYDGNEIVRETLWYYLQPILKLILDEQTKFLSKRVEDLKEINNNGQTIVLQQILRDLYDETGQVIYITNNTNIFDQEYLFKETEIGSLDEDFYIYEENTSGNVEYIYSVGELSSIYNFSVYVPQYVIDQGATIGQINTTINKYKCFGTTHEIVII